LSFGFTNEEKTMEIDEEELMVAAMLLDEELSFPIMLSDEESDAP